MKYKNIFMSACATFAWVGVAQASLEWCAADIHTYIPTSASAHVPTIQVLLQGVSTASLEEEIVGKLSRYPTDLVVAVAKHLEPEHARQFLNSACACHFASTKVAPLGALLKDVTQENRVHSIIAKCDAFPLEKLNEILSTCDLEIHKTTTSEIAISKPVSASRIFEMATLAQDGDFDVPLANLKAIAAYFSPLVQREVLNMTSGLANFTPEAIAALPHFLKGVAGRWAAFAIIDASVELPEESLHEVINANLPAHQRLEALLAKQG